MLPRDKFGVVDAQLKVSNRTKNAFTCLFIASKFLLQAYGTTNLRIVDVSIVPIHIAAHTQSSSVFIYFFKLANSHYLPATAYVIGEKG